MTLYQLAYGVQLRALLKTPVKCRGDILAPPGRAWPQKRKHFGPELVVQTCTQSWSRIATKSHCYKLRFWMGCIFYVIEVLLKNQHTVSSHRYVRKRCYNQRSHIFNGPQCFLDFLSALPHTSDLCDLSYVFGYSVESLANSGSRWDTLHSYTTSLSVGLQYPFFVGHFAPTTCIPVGSWAVRLSHSFRLSPRGSQSWL